MGEVGNSKTKKRLIALLLLSILAMSSANLIYSPGSSTDLQSNGSKQLNGLEQSQQLAPDPQASARPVNESAVGFDSGGGSGRTVNLPSSGNDFPVTLDYGWSANKANVTVFNIWDQRNWVRNGTFDTGRNTPYPAISPPWTYCRWWDIHPSPSPYYTDDPKYDSGNWVSSGGKSYVNVSMPWLPLHAIGLPPGARQFYYLEYSAWNETFVVPRGNVLAANLSLAYHPNYVKQLAYGDFKIYVEVNSHIVWWRDFVAMNSSERGKWNVRTSISILTDLNGSSVFNTPAQPNMSISLGVLYTGPSMWYWDGLAVSQNGCWFDNVTLVLKTVAKPDQIQLRLRAPSGGPSTSIVATGWGNGTGLLTGFTIGPATLQTIYYFGFPSNVTYPASASFKSNATIYVTGQKTATTSFISQGSVINWSVSFVTTVGQSPQSVGTTSYSRYYFNVSIPKDWNLTTCTDPNSANHNIKTDPNFSNTTIGSIRILKINVAGIGSYSHSPNYYPYVIHAASNNYVKYLVTKLQSGLNWVDTKNFYPKQTGKFVAYIKGSSPVSSGIANLTIRGPPTYNASPVVLKTITGVTPSSGWANFTLLWNATNAAGNYTGQVDWVDNNLGEAGSLTCDFNITHTFRLVLSVPADQDTILKGGYIISPPATAKVFDAYTNDSITATVKGITSWETYDLSHWHAFTLQSANLTYTNITSVWSSLVVGSKQWIAVNATKGFYDLATANNTVWIGVQSVCNVLSPSINVHFAEPDTFYVMINASYTEGVFPFSNIQNATLTLLADISTNNSFIKWNSRVGFEYGLSSNGRYGARLSIGTLSASLKAIPTGTYTVWLRLYQGHYYQTQTFIVPVSISPPSSYLDEYVVGGREQTVFWGHWASVKLNYTTYWNYGGYTMPRSPILNYSGAPTYAPPYISLVCNWAGRFTANYSVFDPAGTYTVYFDTSSFTTPTPDGSGAGTTTFIVKFNKTGYQLSNGVNVILHIKSLTTAMTGAVQSGPTLTLTNATTAYRGDRATIFFWYNDTHLGRNVGVGSATLQYVYRSSLGTYLGSGYLGAVSGIQGLYNLTLTNAQVSQVPGIYYLYVGALEPPYYVTRNITVTLNILQLSSILQSYVIGSDGRILVQQNVTVTKGDTFTIYLWFNDTHNNLPVLGAASSITYTSAEFGTGWVSEVPGIPGLYSKQFQGSDAGDWSITFEANVTGYAVQTFNFRVVVKAPASFDIFTVVLVGFGGGGLVLAGVIGWIVLRRARVPFVIKKINETLGLINKGEHEQATLVPLKSRDEAIAAIMLSRVESFTKRKPAGEEEVEAGIEVAPPPSPETSAALKEELKAVEGKEKPEEGIEEVEMDTLDEQLQQLEKVETKENLPDGAKEVRDVIEKYKEGKKKKK